MGMAPQSPTKVGAFGNFKSLHKQQEEVEQQPINFLILYVHLDQHPLSQRATLKKDVPTHSALNANHGEQ